MRKTNECKIMITMQSIYNTAQSDAGLDIYSTPVKTQLLQYNPNLD